MKDFKYKLTFASQIYPIKYEEAESFISIASKDIKLEKILPSNVDLEKHVGFSAFYSEAFIANKLNLNADGVETKQAIEISKLFPFGYIDYAHNRKNIVGVIANSSFADYYTKKPLVEKDVSNTDTPFLVTIGGIIWKAPNPEFAEEIENCDNSDSENFNKLFISWELAFDKYNAILIDPDKTDFNDGKIITDEAEVDKLSQRMKCYGGTGMTAGGLKIGRIPIGDVIPLGVGIVLDPAGQVSPLQPINPSNNNSDSSNSSKFEYKPDLQSVNKKNTKPNSNMDKIEENKVEDVTKDKKPDFTLDNPSLKKLIKFYKKDKINIDKYGNELAASIDKLCSSRLEKLSFGICPECQEIGDSDSKRYANGKTYCGSCGYMTASKEWRVDEIKNIEFIEKNKKILKEMYEPHKNNQLNKEDYLKQLEDYLDVFKGQSPIKGGENDGDLEKINKDELIDKNVNILSASFVEVLKKLPEDGMGYQKVDLEMNDGSIIKEIIVRNCSILPENINASNVKNVKKSTNSISQAQNTIVKDNKSDHIDNKKNMKIEKIEQVTDDNLKEIKASELKEIFASNIKTTLDTEIQKISQDYTNKLTEKENLIKAANETAEDLKKQVNTLNTNFNEVKANYEKLNKENEERAKVEAFSSRMEVVEDKFDFNEKQKETIANKIKNLTSDKDFTDCLTEMEVLFEKNKKVTNNITQTSTASVNNENKIIETAIKNGENKDKEIPNTGSTEETLKQKYQKAFGMDGWQIINKRVNRVM